MAEISRAAFFKKLNSVGYKCFEAATVSAKMAGNPYIEITHLLNQALTLQDSDVHHIVNAFENFVIGIAGVQRRLHAALNVERRPSQQRPVLNDSQQPVLFHHKETIGVAGRVNGVIRRDNPPEEFWGA